MNMSQLNSKCLVTCLLGLSSGAGRAQDATQESPPQPTTTHQVEVLKLRGHDGPPAFTVTVSSRVPTDDLHLSTPEGQAQLQARVHAAAVRVCAELALRGQPNRQEEASCVERTADVAMARTIKRLASAH